MLEFLRRRRELASDYARVADLLSLKRLSSIGLERQHFLDAGAALNVPAHHLKAFHRVESSSDGFTAQGRLKILYEPHIVHRRTHGRLTGRKFDWQYNGEKIQIPLSYRRWRPHSRPVITKPVKWHPYFEDQVGQWEMLALAYEQEEGALEGVSLGAFQVLGRWYRELGFGSAFDLVAYLYQGEINHLDVAVRYLRMSSPRAIPALQKGDWETVALLYNGSGNVRTFAGKMERAAEQSYAEFNRGRRMLA